MLGRTREPEVMDTVEEAVDYDAMDHSSVNQLFVADLLQLVSQFPAALQTRRPFVLDLGTGTARIPIELAARWPQCPPIAACDLSFEMLRLALHNIGQDPQAGVVAVLYCDAKCLPVASGSVSLVMSNSIVHHIPEPADVFREMRRCVAPDGLLFVRDLMRPSSEAEVEQIVQTWAGGENEHQQRMFRESLHAALTVEEVNTLLEESGFHGIRAFASSDRHWTVSASMSAVPRA